MWTLLYFLCHLRIRTVFEFVDGYLMVICFIMLLRDSYGRGRAPRHGYQNVINLSEKGGGGCGLLMSTRGPVINMTASFLWSFYTRFWKQLANELRPIESSDGLDTH